MRIGARMRKADWRAIVSRVAGVLVLLVGVLLAARLCAASPHDNLVASIFEPDSTASESILHLSHFDLGITGLIFLVLFTLVSDFFVRFGSRKGVALCEALQDDRLE